MITRLVTSGIALSLLAAASLSAGTITLYDTVYDGGLPGGEFRAVTSDHGTFYTFCLEYNEYLTSGATYNYTVSNGAKSGGVGGAVGGIDIISQGTAYLYELFTLDGLTGYSSDHDTNAGWLQKAFWYLEDEWSYSSAGGASNPYLNLVISAFGSTSDAKINYTGANVAVMNIVSPSGVKKQDQLVYVSSVPDGGLTVGMLGLALTGLAFLRRKRAVA